MAYHKSALKRIRSNEKRRVRNRYYGKTMRNAIRIFRAIDNKEEAAEKYPALISLIDKNAKRNIIHQNKAGNLKSKLTRRLNALS
ncbi:MAG: 30S ribosomal protein S20 [Bacteroidales bacterium]|nr:30S ribosomal protein S20 [Bacteroidales bacterium]